MGGNLDMNKKICSAVILSFALSGVVSAQVTSSPAANGAQYTNSQLKQMVRDAHTPEQYGALAAYYASRQSFYAKQAAEEQQEWVRRSQNIVSIAAKYPRPVDSARYLYEYYGLMARESGQLAGKYRQLSDAEAPGSAK
jgi:hypothetical protein